MGQKGAILIVDDREDEKIGKFKNYLINDGYNVVKAETLEQAEQVLAGLLKDNKLDGIILDLSFPVNDEDQSVVINNQPCGVDLFKRFEFKISTQRVPVVINTTADEDFKKKYFGDLRNLKTPAYNVNHAANPLAQPNAEMVRDIITMFNERTEQRNRTSSIQPDAKWRTGGKSIIYNSKTGGYSYRD